MAAFVETRLADMLQTLRIENLALMDAVSLELTEGYSAVTGETGAGKSILLGALSLLSGARAEKLLIRQGADQCVVEGVFWMPGQPDLKAALETACLPACEEDTLIIRRLIPRTKGSRIQINGAAATLAQLQDIGKLWVDFHGPGEPQKLFHENEQLILLDLFANHRKPLEAYRTGYRQWKHLLDDMERLRTESRLSPEERAFLKTQIDEMDRLELAPDRVQQLEQDHRRMTNAQELKELAGRLDAGFQDDGGITGQLQSMLPLVRELAQLDPSALPLADRLESLLIEAGDLAGEWQQLCEDENLDDEQLQQLDADMESWLSLQRKYGPTLEAVLAKREAMAERLAVQGDLEGTLKGRQAEADKLESTLRKQAADIRSTRLKAAQKLAREAETHLRELGFKRPRLAIEILSGEKLQINGDCSCQMTFSPNPGNALMPLNKIASSGEMARVMLALKSVLATVDATPVLVFDEVDSNIGGEVASSVAALLARLGEDHQVFCITHLPQVASVAKNHYVVTKDQSEKSTTVSIGNLTGDKEARLDELARMLGNRSSGSARMHAEELLKSS